MIPCHSTELCLEMRRTPTKEEELGTWADRDGCMNCKIGREREKEIALSRPPSIDIACIFCYEPLDNTRKRKFPVCSACYGGNLAQWGTGDRKKKDVWEVIAEARKI